MKQDGKSLAETFIHCDHILLVDTSGSMDYRDALGNRSRHDAALDELRYLQKRLPGKLAIISFSSDVMFCPSGNPHRYGMGTNMAKALEFVKPADNCGISFYLITDGEPNSEEETLKVAKTFKSKINCVYIGSESDYNRGRDFLKRLADATGGQHVKSSEIGTFAKETERLLLSG
jgi:hypothetical protein